MKPDADYLAEARLLAQTSRFRVFYREKSGRYEVYRKIPGNRVTLVTKTTSARSLVASMRKALNIEGPTKNPARREDASNAARLAARFHGRQPDENEFYEADKPHVPDAMANIGKVFAIEYLAERDGKEYRFRHVFKVRSRPQLAVSPDGKFVTMIGGSWTFTEDGFEDH